MLGFTARLRAFRRGEDGASSTIEAVIWFPLFVFVLIAVLDASAIFMNYSVAQSVVADGNRALAVGRIATCGDLETWLITVLGAIDPNVTAVCSDIAGNAQVTVTMNSSEMDLSGATGWFGGINMRVASAQIIEGN